VSPARQALGGVRRGAGQLVVLDLGCVRLQGLALLLAVAVDVGVRQDPVEPGLEVRSVLVLVKGRKRLVNVSWTRSSASAGLRVVRRAALYSWSRKGMASDSNRAARSAGVSVLTSTMRSSDVGSSASGFAAAGSAKN